MIFAKCFLLACVLFTDNQLAHSNLPQTSWMKIKIVSSFFYMNIMQTILEDIYTKRLNHFNKQQS